MGEERAAVCVVDDDESVRRSLRRLLKSAGFAVETYAAATDFLQRGQSDIAACLVLDVRMPGMDGLELQRRLVSSHSEIPIVFITAHDDKQAEMEAMEAGATAFLHKPFEAQELIAAVRAALELRAGMDEPKE
jgi:FixJ family two-component response regulator